MRWILALSLISSTALADVVGEGGPDGIIEGAPPAGGASSIVLNDNVALDLGTTGVRLSGASGILTILGQGSGFDENLKLDLDSTTNTGIFTSTSSLAALQFSSINLVAPAFISSAADPADTGVVRLGNGSSEGICSESSPAGSDHCIYLDSSEIWQADVGMTIGGAFSTSGFGITAASFTGSGTITSSRSTDLGWSVVDGTDNTACTAQCTSAAVFGLNLAAGATAPVIVGPSDTSADICLCAGGS